MIQSVRSVASLLLSTFFLLTAMGLSGYLIPVRAVAEGWSTFAISLIATGYAIAFTASCIITPRLVLKVGHVRVFGALTTLMAMSYLLHTLVVDPTVWVLTRAMAGFSIAGAYMIIESWLNEKVSNENRGALFSVYMMVSMSAVMVGQYIVPFGDPSGPTLFMLCTLICSMAVMPTLLSSAQSPQPLTQVKFDVPALYRRSPAAVIGTLLAGVIASAWGGLGPVYATQLGLSTAEGATMLAIAMVGGAIFQYPLGRISDRMDRRRVMIFAGIIGVLACTITVSFGVDNRIIFFAGMLFLGTVLLPIYSLNVAHANDHAEPDEFVEVSSGLMITYGVATMIGPLITGGAMDWFGPHALFVVIAICFAAYSGHAAWRISRREQPSEEMRSNFLPMAAMPDLTPQTAELDPRSDPAWGEQSDEEEEEETAA
ncbi:MFS transporter [Hoeflea sp. AS16]|uniref:MFS transporter n=1 Tax=Hoeflea sp. AS16 TaxID=3135779 RepID=UPI0031812A15